MADLDDRKEILIGQLDRARSRLTANQRELRSDLDLSAKLKTSMRRHRWVWLGCAALAGLAIVKLPARTKKVVVDRKGTKKKDLEEAGKAGLLLAVLKIVFNLAKPLIVAWATKRFGQAVEGNARAGRREARF